MDPSPDSGFRILLFSLVTFRTSKKFFWVLSFFAYYFLKVHFHHFSKIKSHTEVTKQYRNQCFSYYFCLLTEGSGSVSLTNGSGSGGKHMDPTDSDPDPQHWLRDYPRRFLTTSKHLGRTSIYQMRFQTKSNTSCVDTMF
jgi:hypothetical protein